MEAPSRVTWTGLVFHSSTGVALHDITIRSITVQDFPRDGIKICGGDPLNCDDALTDTLIDEVTVTGSGQNGIVLNGGEPSSGATVTDNVSTGNNSDGISTDTSGTYSDNTLNNNNGDGLSARDLGVVVQNNTISGNAQHAIDGNNNGGMTITGNTITGNLSTASAVRVPGTNNVIIDNVITGNTGDGIDGSFGGASGYTITANVVMDNGGEGIAGGGDGGNEIVNNLVVRSGGDGIRANGPGNIIEGNSVLDGGAEGIQIFNGSAEVHFNRIVGNTVGLDNTDAATVDAENNWWGCNEGPNSADCDSTSGPVDADPWLILQLDVPLLTIPENDGFTILASVTMNSDGEDTFGEANIRDGTEVLFATDLGSVGSQSVVRGLEDGRAQTIFIADSGPGTANLSLTLDNEVVNVPVTVTPAATATPSATPTPTASPTPTPSATPGPELTQGDVDCNGAVTSVDALKELRHVAQLSVSQTEPCPDIGTDAASLWGDVDCSGGVTAVDALKILRFVALLSVSQTEPCPDIGTPEDG